MKGIEVFNNLFAQIKNRTGDHDKYRDSAFEAFSHSGLPSRKDEKWKYTSLKSLNVDNLMLPVRAEMPSVKITPTEIEIICTNGFFSIEQISNALSPFQIKVLKYSDALSQGLVKPVEQKDSFGALNSAFYQEGLYLSVSEGAMVDRPIVIRYEITSDLGFINPRV